MLRRILMAASLPVLVLPLLAAKPASAGRPAEPPGIRLWTSHGDMYRRGERVRIFFRTEHDAYVTIFRVDTDGRVRVLFPRDPYDANLAHGGETYDVEGIDDRNAFYVDDYPGVGYVFGVASDDPFVYDPLIANDHWSIEAVANLTDGRIHGDPYASLQDLVQHIEPEGYADYDTHLLPYYVEQRYDYPRFLCYDCHTYVPYAYWNPYAHFCSRFSLFVYYDPYYFYPSYWYPTRYYGGTAVVYVRPRYVGSQYVFKAPGDQSAPSVVFRDRRGFGTQSTPADRGVRGVDIGGVGSVPAPVGGGRRMAGGGLQSPGGTPAMRPPSGGGQDQPGIGDQTGGRDKPGRGQPGGGNDRTRGGDQGQGKDRGWGNDPGRRHAVTDLGVIGPSAPTPESKPAMEGPQGRRYIGETPGAAVGRSQATPETRPPKELSPDAQRRGVYIDPGSRAEPRATPQPQRREPEAGSAGRYSPPPAAQPRSMPAPRSFSPPAASRGGGGGAPRAQPRGGDSRPSGRSGGTPTLIRRRP